jgi:8-oxo-dGTP pyrophosphatase MutT (NUDIX family)
MRKEAVCFLLQGGRVLLSPKKLKFKGIWNGYGGKVEPGESERECLARELWQEAGVMALKGDFSQRAYLHIHRGSDEESVELAVFVLYQWQGIPGESEEHGKPCWFSSPELPFQDMFPGDSHWLSRVLAGGHFDAHLWFTPEGSFEKIEFREPTF